MEFFKRHQTSIFLALTIFISALILWPLHNFQDFLSQGDHGRDLYAGQAILRGELPYKDFWWVYGPLMPYVYALLYKLFGMHITSLILGKLIFKILGAVFLFLTLASFASPLTAFLGALWFVIFHQDFFFTYNHVAGTTVVLAITWCLCQYIKDFQIKSAYLALGWVFILSLIKINFGIVALGVVVLAIFTTDKIFKVPFNTAKKMFYVLGMILIPLVLFLIYWSLLKDLSVMEIRQCLPYLGDDQPYNASLLAVLQMFFKWVWSIIMVNWMSMGFALIVLGSLLTTIYLGIQQKIVAQTKMILILVVIALYYVLNTHEFFKSGVLYRYYWAQPLDILLCFALIGIATDKAPAFIRKMVFCFIAIVLLICWHNSVDRIKPFKIPSQAMSFDGSPVYLGNQNAWIQTVEQTATFLQKNLKSDELFLALPYDCIYYYLTNKKSPTRQLIFFDHIKITTAQEQSVIADLERTHTNYVVLSNRAFAHQEYGLGMFGKTYCPLLAAYIQEHFTPIARFGDWTDEPGWAWNHGTLILKRKLSLLGRNL